MSRIWNKYWLNYSFIYLFMLLGRIVFVKQEKEINLFCKLFREKVDPIIFQTQDKTMRESE